MNGVFIGKCQSRISNIKPKAIVSSCENVTFLVRNLLRYRGRASTWRFDIFVFFLSFCPFSLLLRCRCILPRYFRLFSLSFDIFVSFFAICSDIEVKLRHGTSAQSALARATCLGTRCIETEERRLSRFRTFLGQSFGTEVELRHRTSTQLLVLASLDVSFWLDLLSHSLASQKLRFSTNIARNTYNLHNHFV